MFVQPEAAECKVACGSVEPDSGQQVQPDSESRALPQWPQALDFWGSLQPKPCERNLAGRRQLWGHFLHGAIAAMFVNCSIGCAEGWEGGAVPLPGMIWKSGIRLQAWQQFLPTSQFKFDLFAIADSAVHNPPQLFLLQK